MRLTVSFPLALAIAAGLSAAAPAPAHAGDAPDRVRIEAQGTRARITVTQTLRVSAAHYTQVSLHKPPHAAVIAGSVRHGKRTYPMTLVRAETAREQLEALAAAPPSKDMATLFAVTESASDAVDIAVMVPRAGAYTIQLELDAPACFEDDVRHVAVPTAWTTVLARSTLASDERGKELARRCNQTIDHHDVRWVALPARDLARRPPGVERIGVTASHFATSTEQAAHVELALARALTTIPRDLHTVFVVDTSRSLTAGQQESARAIIRSYLAHAPQSSVQVVTYARQASAVLDRWTLAKSASRAIDTHLASLTPHNGSELPTALHEAATWLAKARGTRRLVIISDERVANRIANIPTATLARDVPRNTLVHVVALASGGVGLTRDDDARWAALAAGTAGMATRAGTSDLDALRLVRPIALDHVRVRADSWTPLVVSGHACMDEPSSDAEPALRSLAEGRSCTWWGTKTGATDTLTLEGFVWGTHWTKTIPLASQNDVALARQLRFVLDASSPLAIAALDAAKAVSERWSFVARWGGRGGYAETSSGGSGRWGAICGCDGPGTIGHGSGTGSGRAAETPLRDQLAAAVRGCMRDDIALALTVELTRDEIVDVDARVTLRDKPDVPADAAAVATCVEEAVWATHVGFLAPRDHDVQQLTY